MSIFMPCRVNSRRRSCLAVLATAIAASAWPQFSSAQSQYPSRPIRVIVPFPPGGINDTIARPILQKIGGTLNASIVIENRPGASGTIGTALAARAEPDGYTLLLGAASTMAVVPHMLKSVPYSPTTDFVPIGGLASVPSVLITGRPDKYPDFAAILKEARQHPDKLTYGSAGPGTSHHVQMAYLNLKMGLSMLHVPYKGSGPAMTDLMGGQVDFLMDPLPTTLPQIASGRIVPIAISSATRSPLLPNVPTFMELGVQDFEVSTWFGLFAPAKTPQEILGKLASALDTTLRSPTVAQDMASHGMLPLVKPSTSMATYVAQENSLWKSVIAKTRIGSD